MVWADFYNCRHKCEQYQYSLQGHYFQNKKERCLSPHKVLSSKGCYYPQFVGIGRLVIDNDSLYWLLQAYG